MCAPDLICCLRLPDISIMLRPRPQPIRGQYSGHVIYIDQSQASIQAVISPGAGRGQRQTPSGRPSQQDQHTSGQTKTESLSKRLINSISSSSTTLYYVLCWLIHHNYELDINSCRILILESWKKSGVTLNMNIFCSCIAHL